MKKRKVLCYAAAATVIGFLVLMAWPESAPPRPDLSLVSVEPAEMRNESGAALWLVTFNVNQPQGGFLKDIGNIVETRSGSDLSGAQGVMAGVSSSRTQAQAIILVPVGTTSCRISLKYAKTVVPIESQMATFILPRLPPSIRRAISVRWGIKWFYPQAVPGRWRKVSLELPLPPGGT